MESTPHGLGTDDLTVRLVAVALSAHRCLDGTDPVDYWYRLGQRNAYTQAVGFLLAGGDTGQAWAVAGRVKQGLTDGVTGVAELASAAWAATTGELRSTRFEWLGPAAFQRQAGNEAAGRDHEVGGLGTTGTPAGRGAGRARLAVWVAVRG